MTLPPVAFTDLDDTLFQTAGKCPDGTAEGLRPMSRLLDGSVSGYATRQQEDMLDWLRIGRVIPVTARSRSVLARVDIEQAPAICSNGGCVIAPDGSIDRGWHEHLAKKASETEAVADVYRDLTGNLAAANFRHWIVDENELPLFIVIKANHDNEDALGKLGHSLAGSVPPGWRMHHNGNNLAYLPGWLNKRHAVHYLIQGIRAESPERLIVGVGDSLSDAGFMDLCDYAVTPTRSQLWQHMIADNAWIG